MFKEVHSPTGVELAVVCNFLNSYEENLVISTANELQVYRMNHNIGNKSNDTELRKEPEKSIKSKLECLLTFKLFEKVVSIQPIKIENNTDFLLLCFQEAKLSLVQYDREMHDLKTTTLHNYEFDYLKDGREQNVSYLPIARCDPESRCAAALLYGNRMAVFPLFKNESGISIGYSYIIDLRKLNEKVTHVVDFQFLHGFCEPTVAMLYEPLPTWSGRIAIKKDSFSMVAISLNLEQQVNPSIWSVSGLPFDAFQLLPVPKPLGGLLVFATNSLMYFNQSCPPHAVSLNCIGSATTDFLLKDQKGVELTLDCCQACFVRNDKVLISLKEGDLYVLTLLNDNTRTIRGFHFDKAASCVLTTCICVIEEEFLFLGSRLGNSLLLKYSEKQIEDGNAEDDCKSSDILEDPEELELYGKGSTRSTLMQYSFEVCDSILNNGPCGHAVMGCAASLSEEFVDSDNPDVELVTTSGFNKSGAISILQRSIRPQLVTTFKMSDCVDVWTVVSKDESQSAGNIEEYEEDDDYHSLMILSEPKTTMILRAGIEISELDQSGFITQAPTIFAGNIGGNQYIIQVSTCAVRLLEGTKCLQHVALTQESPVISCSLADPHLALLTESGQVLMISLKQLADGPSSRLVLCKPLILKNVVALSMYRDDSGLFCSQTYADPSTEVENSDGDIEMLDEDELLYGVKQEKSNDPKAPAKESSFSLKTSTHWLVTSQSNGDLLIYSVPNFEVKFKSWNFIFGHQVLCNNLVNEPEIADTPMPEIRELLMVGMGNKNLRPHLMAIIDQELIIYEAYEYMTASDVPILQLRFKKVLHSLSARDVSYQVTDLTDKEALERNVAKSKRKLLRQFENVSGLTGVFLCGACPHWIFMTYRGILRFHPMVIDGPITFLASFHNVNCPKGFLYLNLKCDLRISMLPTNLIYDSPWPVRRIPLRCTPYYVAYHPEDKFYAVVMSLSKPCDKLVKIVGDNEKEIETVERKGKFIYPTIEKFLLQFYSPLSWEPIPQCRLEFDEFERVTCMQLINFKSEGTMSGLKGYIVCGTTYSYTEDIPCKGRIIVMDIIEVVPEPGAPLTKNKLKIEYNREQKGGVSAVAGVHGLLVTAIGQKIYIWQMKDGDLKGVAFIDAQIYAHSIVVVKSLLFVGDAFKSVTLYRYQEDMKVLSVVSRDMLPREIYSLEFLVNNEDLYFMATDSDKNLLVYSYQPEIKESIGGQKLIHNACFKIGSHVNSMFRIRCSSTNSQDDPFVKRQTTYICTLDGGIGCVVPLPEKMYRRLLMLQTVLTWYTSHLALLNPKAARYSKCSPKQLSILDGVLISKFHELSFAEKKEVAGRIGTSLEQILSDMVNIEMCTSHF